jgi:hypothetical protein
MLPQAELHIVAETKETTLSPFLLGEIQFVDWTACASGAFACALH